MQKQPLPVRFVSLFVESDNLVTVPYMVDWLFWRKKTCLHAVVDVLALEADPIAFHPLVPDG